MNCKINKQMSESMEMGIVLSLTGGFLDAYTYISRGHVFANAQTGNMVLMGMYFSQGDFIKGLYYLIPISSFAIGILIVEIIKKHFKNKNNIHWRQIVLAIEILLLTLVAFIPSSLNMLANVIVSFVCSLQVQSFRKINGNVCATTMCTGNLRTATECLCKYIGTKDKKFKTKSLHYYGINILFIIGACLGTVLTNRFNNKAILVCALFLFIGFNLMFISEKKNKDINALAM